MKFFIFIFTVFFSVYLSAQNCGQISGIVYSADSTEVMPFVLIKLTNKSDTLLCYTNINGEYKFSDLKKEAYKLNLKSHFYGSKSIHGIHLTINDTIDLDIFLNIYIKIIICCPTICQPIFRFYLGNEMVEEITRKDIKQVSNIKIEDRLLNRSSEFKIINDNITTRGARVNNLVYYIDGIRQNNTPILPRMSVRKITYYLGGLPARFGETTSGAVIVNTTSYFDLYYDWKARQ